MKPILTASILVSALVTSVQAHEFWVEPNTHRASVNSPIQFQLKFGERFRGEPLRRNQDHIERFSMVGASKPSEILGLSGSTRHYARTAKAGMVAATYLSKPVHNQMEAKAFEDYLKHEGLGFIVKERAARGESDKEGCEVFTRCAKALIQVGEAGEAEYDNPVGLPLELVCEKNPYRLAKGEVLPVKVLFMGRPLDRTTVVFVERSNPDRLIQAVTNADGLVYFEAPNQGVWMATTIHMVRADEALGADWHSLWGSLTFEIVFTQEQDEN